MEGDINYKEYLSMIYGDDIVVIFDKYIFIPSDTDDKGNQSIVGNTKGRLLYTNGAKVITEEIDGVIPIVNVDAPGYIIFLGNDLEEMYKVSPGNVRSKKMAVINQDGTFSRCIATYSYFSAKHPEIIIRTDKSKYIGRFDGNILTSFTKIGR